MESNSMRSIEKEKVLLGCFLCAVGKVDGAKTNSPPKPQHPKILHNEYMLILKISTP